MVGTHLPPSFIAPHGYRLEAVARGCKFHETITISYTGLKSVTRVESDDVEQSLRPANIGGVIHALWCASEQCIMVKVEANGTEIMMDLERVDSLWCCLCCSMSSWRLH